MKIDIKFSINTEDEHEEKIERLLKSESAFQALADIKSFIRQKLKYDEISEEETKIYEDIDSYIRESTEEIVHLM